MEIGRHRSRRRHRARQPEVRRHLRALGQHGGQDQGESEGLDRGFEIESEQRREAGGARLPDQVEQGDEHRQAARHGDQEGVARRAQAGLALGTVAADQKEGAEPGQFPEDVEKQQVVGQDQTQHGRLEGGEQGDGPAGLAAAVEVVAGVVQDQQPDRGHHDGQSQGRHFEAPAHVDWERGSAGPDGRHSRRALPQQARRRGQRERRGAHAPGRRRLRRQTAQENDRRGQRRREDQERGPDRGPVDHSRLPSPSLRQWGAVCG